MGQQTRRSPRKSLRRTFAGDVSIELKESSPSHVPSKLMLVAVRVINVMLPSLLSFPKVRRYRNFQKR